MSIILFFIYSQIISCISHKIVNPFYSEKDIKSKFVEIDFQKKNIITTKAKVLYIEPLYLKNSPSLAYWNEWAKYLKQCVWIECESTNDSLAILFDTRTNNFNDIANLINENEYYLFALAEIDYYRPSYNPKLKAKLDSLSTIHLSQTDSLFSTLSVEKVEKLPDLDLIEINPDLVRANEYYLVLAFQALKDTN